jgi:hypothetical protein
VEGGRVSTPVEITAVVKSAGCTLAPPGDLVQGVMVERHMQVSGTIETDSTDTNIDGPWTMDRQYFVRLPLGYDSTRAYPLVIQGPGCGGNGLSVYELPDIADELIKVGLTPPDPAVVGHVEAPGAGCFDGKERRRLGGMAVLRGRARHAESRALLRRTARVRVRQQ